MLPAPDGAPEPRVVRFGVYEFRFDTLTLSKYGLKIKLQEQPSRVLGLLLQNAGQIVTRESLKQEFWPDSSFGEFDSGLNTALSKVRSALSDSGLRPTFIERVPGKVTVLSLRCWRPPPLAPGRSRFPNPCHSASLRRRTAVCDRCRQESSPAFSFWGPAWQWDFRSEVVDPLRRPTIPSGSAFVFLPDRPCH